MSPRALALALAFSVSATAGPLMPDALALDTFSAQLFEPPIDPFGYVTVNGGKTLGAGDIHVAAYYDWARRPLPRREPIGHIDWLDLVASYGIAEVHEG